MRLRPATALDEFERESVSGFGDRDTRRERREARRERKGQRREERRDGRVERKSDRRLGRVRRKKEKVREKLAPGPRAARGREVARLQPAPMSMPPPMPGPGPFVDPDVDWADEFLDDVEDDIDEATEGIGAGWAPFRRPAAREAWGPVVGMGRRLRIQAAVGHRAAVIELKPGLYLVADLPEAVARTEFGFAPLLIPLMMNAARRSMDAPGEGRGPFARMFRRRREEAPVRYVQVQPPAPSPAPLALPGPVEDTTVRVAAPNVGWADDASVAAAYGCDTCAHRGCR